MDLGENLMAHQKSLKMIGGGLRSAPSSLSSREMFLVVWRLFTGHRCPCVWLKSLGLIHKTEDVGNHTHIRFAEYFKNIMFEIFWVSYINSLSIRLGGSSWFRTHPRAIAPWLCLVVLSMDELKDVLKSDFGAVADGSNDPWFFCGSLCFPLEKGHIRRPNWPALVLWPNHQAKRSLFLVAVLACGSTDASASTAHRKSPGFGPAGLGQAEPGDHHRKNHKQRVGQGCGNGQEFGS